MAAQQINTSERNAAEAMYRVLRVMPCKCRREYPYSGKLVEACSRCEAMTSWEAAELARLA